MLRPAIAGDADAGAQNRFTALRSFRLLACDAYRGARLRDAADFHAGLHQPGRRLPVRPGRGRA